MIGQFSLHADHPEVTKSKMKISFFAAFYSKIHRFSHRPWKLIKNWCTPVNLQWIRCWSSCIMFWVRGKSLSILADVIWVYSYVVWFCGTTCVYISTDWTKHIPTTGTQLSSEPFLCTQAASLSHRAGISFAIYTGLSTVKSLLFPAQGAQFGPTPHPKFIRLNSERPMVWKCTH